MRFCYTQNDFYNICLLQYSHQHSVSLKIFLSSWLKSLLKVTSIPGTFYRNYTSAPHAAHTLLNTAIKTNLNMDSRTSYISKLYIKTARILSGMLFFLIEIAMSGKVCSINTSECMNFESFAHGLPAKRNKKNCV